MSTALVYALCGASLVGVGLYGFITRAHLLRRILAFNIIGSGIFLLLGGAGSRQGAVSPDPVPQAVIITGIVVALSLTALAVALLVRLVEDTGRATLPGEDASRDA
ncbi:NADH-quinone oxidoreductase subunit K [Lutibaculum baratangense]|uniref:Na(+) H(+) antiporter subunit C n=1 Tax=Lutibaculum baratangense AMV1 TaxID=631454 RepID=V4REF5_9HYPH|nr:NADH-quinone oxidoreductase subunit K [Lutibaculum baratangense]ESR24516.1 hypothetical protein N177_2350 [Lutibaculum baratangense AMV1]